MKKEMQIKITVKEKQEDSSNSNITAGREPEV